MKIWDAHSHWMPPGIAQNTAFFRQGWSDMDSLLNTMDKEAVEKAVLLYPSSDAHLNMGGWGRVCNVYNEEISKKMQAYPDRFIGTGILPVDNPSRMIEECKKIRDLGLLGLSVASSYDGRFLDDEIFLPVWEWAEDKNMPVFVHSQIVNPIGFERVNDPLLMPVVEYLFDITMCAGKLMMSGVFSRFSNLKFIFAHFAGVLPFLADRFDDTYSMLRMRNIVRDLNGLPCDILRNIYVDTSGVKTPAVLKTALDFFGPKKVLWGSDFPAKRDLSAGIKALRNAGIKEDEVKMILQRNLTDLFLEKIDNRKEEGVKKCG